MKTSLAMAEAMVLAYDHGGVLVRHSGGYWSCPNAPTARGIPNPHVSTRTVQALIERGEFVVIEEGFAQGSKYPKKVKLKGI